MDLPVHPKNLRPLEDPTARTTILVRPPCLALPCRALVATWWRPGDLVATWWQSGGHLVAIWWTIGRACNQRQRRRSTYAYYPPSRIAATAEDRTLARFNLLAVLLFGSVLLPACLPASCLPPACLCLSITFGHKSGRALPKTAPFGPLQGLSTPWLGASRLAASDGPSLSSGRGL